MVKLFLNSSKNGGDIAGKLCAWAGRGQTKTTYRQKLAYALPSRTEACRQ